MAKQLHLKLQTPTIELPVSFKDSSFAKDSIIVGFKRYNLTEAEKVLEELADIAANTTVTNLDNLNNFIKSKVVYVKKVELTVDEDGKETKITVADTRTVKPVDGLWEGSEDCLAALLDLYLDSAPYRSSLMEALNKALLNVDFSEGERKN